MLGQNESREWVVTEEAVSALKKQAEVLQTLMEEFSAIIDMLRRGYEENSSGLGAHSDDIEALLDELAKLVEVSKNPINKLSFGMLKAAAIRQAHIEQNVYVGRAEQSNLPVDSFVTDVTGLKSSMSLGKGDSGVKQLSDIHKRVQKQDGPGYESHHIPSAAALREFGIDTNNWPTIALTKEDHAKTDSYRAKQKRKGKSIFPDVPESGTYKEETIAMLSRPGGFFELVRDEIYNIREACGEKYDGAISQYLDEIVAYVKKNGVPTKDEE